MGLAGAKKRTKLSHDPNNTAWSRSTTNFGHKILTSQGWKPGDYLGAENAAHAAHYTAANASHIRIMLREDNLGLGAQIGKGNAETFGLSMFSGLLGRLNGKDDAVLQKQEDARRDVELRAYSAQKYGFMNFVRGGFLVGDEIKPHLDGAQGKTLVKNSTSVSEAGSSRKRKATTQEEPEPVKAASKSKKSKEKSKRTVEQASSGRSTGGDETTPSTEPIADSDAKATEDKKREKERRKAKELAESEESGRKQEKRARKEERRRRKEEKRLKREASKNGADSQSSSSHVSSETEAVATPPPARANAPPANLGRHAVRHRYIQQKRMASMDPQALKEIFMLQAAAS